MRKCFYACIVRFVLLSLALLVSACNTVPKVESNKMPTSLLIHQDSFPGHKSINVESEREIYALNQEMQEFVHYNLLRIEDPKQRAEALLSKLFKRSATGLLYNQGANLTAQQTFEQQSANCLSLTILAYALAKEANLKINFQEVMIPEYWVRQGSFNMLSRHVNLVVVGDDRSRFQTIWGQQATTIDFDPFIVKKHFARNVISKKRVTSMFYNNLGATALTQADFPRAYAYFKAALKSDPQYSAVWGNLGYLYKIHKYENLARESYLRAITMDQANYNAWNNLGILLREIGNTEKSEEISEFITNIRSTNPYYHAVLADEAYHNGMYKKAISHYITASEMQPKEDEFYFGLAKAYLKLGEYELSERYLNKAKNNAEFPDVEEKYAQKLRLLSKL
ncbi:tetratricopeptide repeat protein [Thalassotalea litorea]|uniref:Tetratricopeptide repeat protein n=1 Tax=Thalassotalea litorea TaxID=2020715 RepID=A0A5R9ISN9_9GAMM|nr:tetratricopeptide repeat protein [Thalassotalea litorea]TLU66196.1 tetratricopeptide repeat protein [Thalassotalea litorea]